MRVDGLLEPPLPAEGPSEVIPGVGSAGLSLDLGGARRRSLRRGCPRLLGPAACHQRLGLADDGPPRLWPQSRQVLEDGDRLVRLPVRLQGVSQAMRQLRSSCLARRRDNGSPPLPGHSIQAMAGSPRGMSPPGLPQIQTCPIKASGSSCHDRRGTAHRVDRDRWRKRVALQEAIESIPSHPAAAPSPARQPTLPDPGRCGTESAQRH